MDALLSSMAEPQQPQEKEREVELARKREREDEGNNSDIRTSTSTVENPLAASASQFLQQNSDHKIVKPKQLTQLCLDLGQEDIGCVRCQRCGMIYQHQPEDVRQHQRLCKQIALKRSARDAEVAQGILERENIMDLFEGWQRQYSSEKEKQQGSKSSSSSSLFTIHTPVPSRCAKPLRSTGSVQGLPQVDGLLTLLTLNIQHPAFTAANSTRPKDKQQDEMVLSSSSSAHVTPCAWLEAVAATLWTSFGPKDQLLFVFSASVSSSATKSGGGTTSCRPLLQCLMHYREQHRTASRRSASCGVDATLVDVLSFWVREEVSTTIVRQAVASTTVTAGAKAPQQPGGGSTKTTKFGGGDRSDLIKAVLKPSTAMAKFFAPTKKESNPQSKATTFESNQLRQRALALLSLEFICATAVYGFEMKEEQICVALSTLAPYVDDHVGCVALQHAFQLCLQDEYPEQPAEEKEPATFARDIATGRIVGSVVDDLFSSHYNTGGGNGNEIQGGGYGDDDDDDNTSIAS